MEDGIAVDVVYLDLTGNLCGTQLANKVLPCFSECQWWVLIKSVTNPELAKTIPKQIQIQGPHLYNHYCLNNQLQPPDVTAYRRNLGKADPGLSTGRDHTLEGQPVEVSCTH